MTTKALIIINLGTPDKPTKSAVRRYLSEFLNDRRVIDLPWLAQKILVNAIIIPFRTSKSTKLYKRVWTEIGSPLLLSINKLRDELTAISPIDTHIYAAMRYGTQNLKTVLSEIKSKNYSELIFFPLFPQYASSTTGSVYQEVMDIIRTWNVIPAVRFAEQYYNHPAFISAFAKQIELENPAKFDHILFSYHGLPVRHTDKIHPSIKTEECTCEQAFPEHGKYCYKATCYETTRLLVKELNLKEHTYSVAFQSRLSNNWLSPFSDETIVKLAKSGIKRLLVTAPAFTADSLETLIEIREDYSNLFKAHGGEELVLTDSLNAQPHWAYTILQILA